MQSTKYADVTHCKIWMTSYSWAEFQDGVDRDAWTDGREEPGDENQNDWRKMHLLPAERVRQLQQCYLRCKQKVVSYWSRLVQEHLWYIHVRTNYILMKLYSHVHMQIRIGCLAGSLAELCHSYNCTNFLGYHFWQRGGTPCDARVRALSLLCTDLSSSHNANQQTNALDRRAQITDVIFVAHQIPLKSAERFWFYQFITTEHTLIYERIRSVYVVEKRTGLLVWVPL